MLWILISQAVLVIILTGLLINRGFVLKKCRRDITRCASAIESMRVVNHDFKNKMHVLMGYIETDRFEDARSYINNVRTVPTEEVMAIAEVIKSPSIASLVIGKFIEARELGITLHVMPDSVCSVLSKGISENVYVTITGNLLQNAIEELETSGSDDRSIYFYINTDNKWSLISVMDNGNGISPEEREKIFKSGYSTKMGKNRGLGLGIIKKIAEKYNGTVDIESEIGEGTEVNVSLYGI